MGKKTECPFKIPRSENQTILAPSEELEYTHVCCLSYDACLGCVGENRCPIMKS